MFATDLLQAHFEEACYRSNVRGRKLLYVNAVPTLDANTTGPDSDSESSSEDFYKSRPLYSLPALRDHTYANFTAIVPDWTEFEDDERREGIEENSSNATDYSTEMEGNVSCEELRGNSSVTENKPISDEAIDGIDSDIPKEKTSFGLLR